MSRARVQAEQVRVIGLHENVGIHHSDAAIVMFRSVIDQAFGDGHRVMPDLPAGARVHGVGVIRRSDEHDAVHHNRSHFQFARFGNVKDPLRAKLIHVFGRDLIQGGETAARVIAVVR